MKNLPFTGSGVAIITPFNENGIDFDKLGEIIEMQIASKTDAIVVAGTTGEASTMPDPEHIASIEYTVKKVGGRIPVIAGTGANDTPHAVRLTKAAAAAGADAVLSVTPYYNKANKQGLITHFSTIANSCDIPVILYNVPSRTGVNFSIDVLKELAKIDNIVAIKEASGNIGYAAKIAAEIPELHIYSGNDDMVVPILSLGGKGVISVAANILPNEMHDMCALFESGDVNGSRKLQLELLEIINTLFIEVNPVPIKTAMNILGYNVGKLRLPLGDMEPENKEKLCNVLKSYNIKKL